MSSRPTWRQRVAQWLHPQPAPARAVRLYGGARPTRTTGYFGASTTSADAELSSSLATLRSRSRQMVRDAAYAKRAKSVLVNNVIGTGIGLQAQVTSTRDELHERVNASIEQAWCEWCAADSAHTGGALCFADLERAAFGEVFEAGEVLIRLHFRPFGRSRVPLALELIESERLVGNLDSTGYVGRVGEIRMGVEVDEFGRAIAYFIRKRHPGDGGPGAVVDAVERVPADQILHLRLVNRWPQTRGEPWLHTVVRKIDDLSEYSQHEVAAARAAAAYFATIETPDAQSNPLVDEEEANGEQVMNIDPLTIQALSPGEKLAFHTPNRPNNAFAEFNRAMLREIAAGSSVSYESLSRDYSQSNYSSSRLALLDDRDTYRALQQWWVRSLRQPLHRIWMQQAVLARAIPAVPVDAYAADVERYTAAMFKVRGWSWVDPTKEVTAYKEAIKAGMTTLTDVIAATAGGQDIEDVIATRKRELAMLAAAGIDVDTTVEEPQEPAEPAGDATQDDDANRARVVHIARTA